MTELSRDQESFLDQSGIEPGPGRQGRFGAAGPFCRDGQGQAVDCRRPCAKSAGRRAWAWPSSKRPSVPRRRNSRSSPPSEGGAGRTQGPLARDRHRHQGPNALGGRATPCLGLRGPSQRFRRPDPHPRPRAPPDHPDRRKDGGKQGRRGPGPISPIRPIGPISPIGRRPEHLIPPLLPTYPRLPGPLAARLADPQAGETRRGRAERRLVETGGRGAPSRRTVTFPRCWSGPISAG